MKFDLFGKTFFLMAASLLAASCTNDADTPDIPETKAAESFSRSVGTVVFEDDFNQSDSIPDVTKWSLCPPQSSAWNRYMSNSYAQAYVKDG